MLKEIIRNGDYPGWQEQMLVEAKKDYFAKLDQFVTAEYEQGSVYPAKENIFNAFSRPRNDVHVVILGQDPYHEAGQAMGLSFSVPRGCPLPPSLRNIYTEMHDDVGIFADGQPLSGDLSGIADQGVLFLNTVLTVREHDAFSHAGHGWEEFTYNMLKYLLTVQSGVVVGVLWGTPARKNKPLFTNNCGCGHERFVIESAHPSPLSAYRGFFGSKPFSAVNEILRKYGEKEIDWRVLEK
jgi:uracil-DNA glycosylase